MKALYQTFVKIVQQETMVLAAQSLHMTQPTLTRQIQLLERTLGVELFHRKGKRLLLTQAGELVYQYALRFLTMEQRLADELGAIANPEQGVITIAAGTTPSIYTLPPLLAGYREQHPGVKFSIRTGSSAQVVAALQQHEVDVGLLTTLNEKSVGLKAIPLVRDELMFVVPPEHPLHHRGSVRLSEIDRYAMILMREGSGLRQMVLHLVAQSGANLDVVVETDSLESMSRMVQQGMGVAVLPKSAVYEDVARGRLTQIVVQDTTLGARMIQLVFREEGELSAAARQFVEQLPGLAKSLETTHDGV